MREWKSSERYENASYLPADDGEDIIRRLATSFVAGDPVDLRVAVPIIRLKADVDAILHRLVLRNGLKEQPGASLWFDDDLGVVGNALGVDRVADHVAPEPCQGLRISAVERDIPDE